MTEDLFSIGDRVTFLIWKEKWPYTTRTEGKIMEFVTYSGIPGARVETEDKQMYAIALHDMKRVEVCIECGGVLEHVIGCSRMDRPA